jgi:hypothetical protein
VKKIISTIIAFALLLSYSTCVFAVDFEDVSDDDWFAEAVEWAYDESIMNGVSETHFDPHEKITRSMLMTILWRVAGEPSVTSSVPFTDLREDWYKNAIVWAYENGITNGTSATEFSPYEILSREAIATILYRYLTSVKNDLQISTDLSAYSDGNKVSDWATDAISWAIADEIITCSSNSILPAEGVSRAECAFSFMKFCGKYRDILLNNDNPAEDDSYKSIETPSKKFVYTRKYFAKKDNTKALSLYYPNVWEFTVTDRATFTYKGAEVGYITPGNVSSDGWKIVFENSFVNGELKTMQYIEKRGTGSTLSFRHRFVYTGLGETMTAVFDYKYINEKTEEKLLKETYISSTITDSKIGALSSLKNAKNILIIGNSFISTSRVGKILSDMFAANGVKTNVTWEQRGMASLITYVSDSAMMNKIRSGKYDAIFACGMYSEEDVTCLKTLDEACKRSGTTLVLFPAHNENGNYIGKAQSKFPHLTVINWKSEIDALLNGGKKDYWDFCMDDSHLHSTPLAGYVGAHMIYRAIQGTVPTAKISGEISQRTVESKLGDYVKTGFTQKISSSSLKYFD